MSTMKWTDEAIETWLREYETLWKHNPAFRPTDMELLLKAAMLELKRMRAWANRIGIYTYDNWTSYQLDRCLSGDPAPSDEQENKR